MIELHAGQSGEKIIVTLTELVTLDSPFYLFRFTNVLTRDVVAFVRSEVDDESGFPARYNQFDIDTAVVFLNKPDGEWHYEVYEQESDTNTDPALATSLLESGKMLLYPTDEHQYEMYNQAVTFKAYNG